MKNKLLRILMASVMLASMLVSFQITSPTMMQSASAADMTCASSGACLGTVAAVVAGGGGTSSGDGLGGGSVAVGGGGVVAAPTPQSYSPAGNGVSANAYNIRVGFRKAFGTFECAAKNVNGFEIFASGVVTSERQNILWWHDGQSWVYGYGGWYVLTTTCVYPPVSSNVVNKTCLISYNATIDRLSQSRLGAANGVGSSSGVLGNTGDLEKNGIAGCKQNANVALNYNPPSGQNGWGQYRATSNINQVACRFTTTSFDGASKSIGKCASPTTVKGTVGKLTVWCDGFSNSWVIKDWTGTDCKNSTRYPLVCKIPTPATYNGYSGNVQGIRDGENSLVKWGTPQVTGGWGMTNWRSSTVVNAGSTPRNTAINDNSKTQQLFASSLNFSSGMTAGQNLNQQLAFYSAGDSGSPFSMTRNYLYDATFNASHTTIRSIDLKTGVIGTSSYSEAVFARDNKCGPQTSPRIDVIRAIGDTVN